MKIQNLEVDSRIKAIEELRKNVVYYEIVLNEIQKIYDLNGNGEMMKYILTSGKGLLKPKEFDQISSKIEIK